MPRDLDYETDNVGYDEQYPDGGIKCKNYELCESVLPTWWWDCKSNYLCTNCHMLYGTWKSGSYIRTGKGVLNFADDVHCPICFETKRGISYPRCEHMACLQCFRGYDSDETDSDEESEHIVDETMLLCPVCER